MTVPGCLGACGGPVASARAASLGPCREDARGGRGTGLHAAGEPFMGGRAPSPPAWGPPEGALTAASARRRCDPPPAPWRRQARPP